jgi:hypothetical protein
MRPRYGPFASLHCKVAFPSRHAPESGNFRRHEPPCFEACVQLRACHRRFLAACFSCSSDSFPTVAVHAQSGRSPSTSSRVRALQTLSQPLMSSRRSSRLNAMTPTSQKVWPVENDLHKTWRDSPHRRPSSGPSIRSNRRVGSVGRFANSTRRCLPRSGALSGNDVLTFSKCIYDRPYHSFSGPRRVMTRGLKWGVLAGVIAGVIAIVLVDISGIHGPLGGLIAAGVTGVVIWIVSHRIDRPREGSRGR